MCEGVFEPVLAYTHLKKHSTSEPFAELCFEARKRIA